MSLTLPSQTIFHTIESTIKAYRKFAQHNIWDTINDITIDQGLVLLFLNEFPEMTQKEIADLVFKDNASMTRIINTMVKKKILQRSINDGDRRRFKLKITAKGEAILGQLPPIVQNNRNMALANITKNELMQLETILNKIKDNCTKT